MIQLAWFGVIVAVAMTLIYLATGYSTSRRRLEGHAGWAARAFTIWWVGLAGVTFAGALTTTLALTGGLSVNVYVTLTHLNLLLLCLALWGLLYYLVFVYTGDHRWMAPLAAFYIGFYGLLVYFVTAGEPNHVVTDGWSASLEYGQPHGTAFVLAIVGLLVGPQMIAAIAYFMLYFRVTDRTQRVRISVTSLAIFVWFGSSLVASVGGFGESTWWAIASRFVALCAALAIWGAFSPPEWMRARWNLRAYADDPGGAQHG